MEKNIKYTNVYCIFVHCLLTDECSGTKHNVLNKVLRVSIYNSIRTFMYQCEK